MKIENILQMNDWGFDRFIMVIIGAQLALWGFVGLGLLGITFPIVTSLICYLYLIYVPGIVSLRALKLHKLGNIETILYAIGISIAIIMFLGATLNLFLPGLGIAQPISTINLVLTLSLIVSVLCAISFFRDGNFREPDYIEINDLLSPYTMFLGSLPFIAIIGTYLVNYYDYNNVLLLGMFIIICIIVGLILIGGYIPEKYYPLAVFSITLSLLFHTSLISSYIFGWDVNQEYYYANLVILNGFWDPVSTSNVNAMLSIVMLAPTFYNLCFIDLSSIFKIFYVFIFSLIILAIYTIVKKQTSAKIAFLSCFFFASLFTFYTEMLILTRQQIAEFFLAMIILVLLNNSFSSKIRTALLLIFGASMVVSHYGLSYIYTAVFLTVWLLIVIYQSRPFQQIINKITNNGNAPAIKPSNLTLTFLLFYLAFLMIWYSYVNQTPILSIFNLGNRISSTVTSELFNTESVQGLELVVSNQVPSMLHEVTKYFHLASQFFIAVGVLSVLIWKKYNFNKTYVAFGIVNLIICIAGLTVPYFASALNTSRLYHISLIVLAPFGIIGGLFLLDTLSSVISRISVNLYKVQLKNISIALMAVFFIVFLLLNSGFIYEVVNDNPTSLALSQKSILESNDLISIESIYAQIHTEGEVSGAYWISKYSNPDKLVYCDSMLQLSTLISYGMLPGDKMVNIIYIYINPVKNSGDYIYLGYLNTKYNDITGQIPINIIRSGLYNNIYSSGGIYSNGGSKIYIG